MISAILWILICIYKSINLLNANSFKDKIEIDIINSDKIGGLSFLRNLVINSLLQYSICIALAIIASYNPYDYFILYHFFSFEGLVYLLFFLVGLIFSILALKSVDNFLKYKIFVIIKSLNMAFIKTNEQLLINATDPLKVESPDTSQYSSISSILNLSNAIIANNKDIFDFSIMRLLATSIFLPFISSLIQKIFLKS
jgi:hypothetical protein